MVRDLEELVLRVRDSEGRAYIAEAVRCYHAGAYRGAVVLAFAAGMHDLRGKIEELAASGAATAALKNGNTEIAELYRKHQPFEAMAINVAHKHADLLTVSERQKLDALQTTRNICAHPSGHRGSPEEARDVIATIIESLLSRPGLFGVAAAKDLIARACQPKFLGSAEGWDAQLAIVNAELGRVDSGAHPALVSEIVVRLGECHSKATAPVPFTLARVAERADLAKAARALALIYGQLLRSSDSGRTPARAKIANVLNAPWGAEAARVILRCRPSLASELEPDEMSRAVDHVGSGLLESADATQVLAAWILAACLDARNQAYLLSLIERSLTTTLLPAVFDVGWLEAERLFFRIAAERAASSRFAAAEAAIAAVQGLSGLLADRATPAERWAYIHAVVQHSRTTPYPADAATKLYSGGLGPRTPWLAEVLRVPLVGAADVLPSDWPVLLDLARASGEVATPDWVRESLTPLPSAPRRRIALVLSDYNDPAISAAVLPWLAG